MASRKDVRQWYESYGESMDEDLCDEYESALERFLDS